MMPPRRSRACEDEACGPSFRVGRSAAPAWDHSSRPRRTEVPRRAACALIAATLLGCGRAVGSDRRVVVYTSVDDVFAKPILDAFERETGVRVLAAFDAEATKTSGLYVRLLAERDSPRADVFWNGEFARSVLLAKAGVLEPWSPPTAADIPRRWVARGGEWTGFALRARVLVYNKRLVAENDRPRSILDLAAPRFFRQAGIAFPLFGTSATHMGALRARLGREGLEGFIRAMLSNQVQVVDGNSVVRDRVASGELKVGITDTDDASVALQKGLPMGIVFPDQDSAWPGLDRPLGAFLIPSTVGLVRGGPHPDEARRLVDWLLRPRTEGILARGESAQIPVRAGVERPGLLPVPDDLVEMGVSLEAAAEGLDASLAFLRAAFVR